MDIKLKIKKLSKKDISDVVQIHHLCVLELNSKKYSSEKITEWLAQITPENVSEQVSKSNWIVALVNKKIIGFAQYSLTDKIIFQLNIAPGFINKGIGRKLYEFIENEFIRNGINQISLYSTLNALGFYEKVGFRKVKNVKIKLNKEFIDEIEMVKNI